MPSPKEAAIFLAMLVIGLAIVNRVAKRVDAVNQVVNG